MRFAPLFRLPALVDDLPLTGPEKPPQVPVQTVTTRGDSPSITVVTDVRISHEAHQQS